MRLGWTRVAPALLLPLVITCAIARAETTDTVIGQGIGTSVPGVPISTSIGSVVYADPVRLQRQGLTYWLPSRPAP